MQSVSPTISAATAVVSAAAIFAPSGAVPSNPTAPAQPGSPVVGTYDATDGSVFAYATLDIAALPSGAVWQNLLYRRSGAGDWMVAAQFKNTASATTRLDDLSPGVVYDIATQAWNGAGGSAIVSGTSFTASTKSTVPAAISSLTYTAGNDAAFARPQAYLGAGGARWFMCRANWSPSAEKDVIGYDYVVTAAGQSAGTVNAAWAGNSGDNFTNETEVMAVSATLAALSVYVRPVNSSGVKGNWLDGGSIAAASKWGYAAGTAGALSPGTTAGTLAAGDDTRITGAAQKASNLSDVANAATALSNLGGAAKASNLGDLPSASTARSNLGLGTRATQNAGDAINVGTNEVQAVAIRYNSHAGNAISFGWDGSNVRVYVDGSLQGTIPNP